jgi:hypothetical protein
VAGVGQIRQSRLAEGTSGRVVGWVTEARSGMEWIDGGKERKDEAARVAGGDRAGRAEHGEVEIQAGSESLRILELERENLRLTRLVADLLLKNQQLREAN